MCYIGCDGEAHDGRNGCSRQQHMWWWTDNDVCNGGRLVRQYWLRQGRNLSIGISSNIVSGMVWCLHHNNKWGWLYAIRVKSYNPLLWMVARIFWYKIVRVPTYLGKRESPIFLDLDVFADGTFLYQFEIRIRTKKREDLFVSPNSLFLAACVGRLNEFVLYNSYNNCLNWYKNHTVYEFVLYNSYKNCLNW